MQPQGSALPCAPVATNQQALMLSAHAQLLMLACQIPPFSQNTMQSLGFETTFSDRR